MKNFLVTSIVALALGFCAFAPSVHAQNKTKTWENAKVTEIDSVKRRISISITTQAPGADPVTKYYWFMVPEGKDGDAMLEDLKKAQNDKKNVASIEVELTKNGPVATSVKP